MATEIERKFLIKSDAWRNVVSAPSVHIRQGYLSSVKERTVRVRVADQEAFLTVKGVNVGASRSEYEYAIPLADAEAMLDSLCEPPQIDKTRHRVKHEGIMIEIDEFHGKNAGLILAEVELTDEKQHFAHPDWLGREVTDDPRYFNSNLAQTPVSEWIAPKVETSK
jgi:CYTH domain-containing protein